MSKLVKRLAVSFTVAATTAAIATYPQEALKGARAVGDFILKMDENLRPKKEKAPAPVKQTAPAATQAPEAPKAEAAPRAHFKQYEQVEVQTNDKFTVKGGFIAVMNKEGFEGGQVPKMGEEEFDAIVKAGREKGAALYRLTVFDAKDVLAKEAKKIANDETAAAPGTFTLSVTGPVRTGMQKEIEKELKKRGYTLAANAEKPAVDVMFKDHKVQVTLSADDILKAAGVKKKPAAKAAPRPRR